MGSTTIRKKARGARKGDVFAVREMATGAVRAEVCMGASVEHGYAAMTVESTTAEVREALSALKQALWKQTLQLTTQISIDQREHEMEIEKARLERGMEQQA